MLEFNATFLIAMVSFVVFMIIMNAILYKPLGRYIQKRKEIIEGNNEKSKVADEKCDALREWQKTSLEKAQKASKETYMRIVAEYKSKKEAMIDFEKNLSRKEVAVASAELDSQIIDTKHKLDSEVKILADIITEKIVGKR